MTNIYLERSLEKLGASYSGCFRHSFIKFLFYPFQMQWFFRKTHVKGLFHGEMAMGHHWLQRSLESARVLLFCLRARVHCSNTIDPVSPVPHQEVLWVQNGRSLMGGWVLRTYRFLFNCDFTSLAGGSMQNLKTHALGQYIMASLKNTGSANVFRLL